MCELQRDYVAISIVFLHIIIAFVVTLRNSLYSYVVCVSFKIFKRRIRRTPDNRVFYPDRTLDIFSIFLIDFHCLSYVKFLFCDV
jgi:hypothetical protein